MEAPIEKVREKEYFGWNPLPLPSWHFLLFHALQSPSCTLNSGEENLKLATDNRHCVCVCVCVCVVRSLTWRARWECCSGRGEGEFMCRECQRNFPVYCYFYVHFPLYIDSFRAYFSCIVLLVIYIFCCLFVCLFFLFFFWGGECRRMVSVKRSIFALIKE